MGLFWALLGPKINMVWTRLGIWTHFVSPNSADLGHARAQICLECSFWASNEAQIFAGGGGLTKVILGVKRGNFGSCGFGE